MGMKEKPSESLHKDAIGVVESMVLGVAGTAPAFSVSATTATLIGTVGVLAAGSLLYSGLTMFGIAIAFMHLNRVITNAGASYAWVGQVFNPILGFYAGWALLVASAVFMVSGTIPAATATLALVNPELISNHFVVSSVAAMWLILVSVVLLKGIKSTSLTQMIMTSVEIGVLSAVIIGSIYHFGKNGAHPFSWKWFYLTEFTPSLFSSGALISLFFFWGWDVTLNLNEETKDSAVTPGLGAVGAMIIALLVFIGFEVAVLLAMDDAQIQASGTNILVDIAKKLLPYPWSYLSVIAVMLSSVGTLETSILQFTRTMYAKARDGALKPRYAILHKSWKTPWVATSVIVVIGLSLLFMTSFFPNLNIIIKDSVNAIGFQVAFYYGLAGYACAWHFRKKAMKGIYPFITLMLWPAFSASFLVFISLYSIPTFDWITNLFGIGGILLGTIPLYLNKKNKYF